MAELDDKNEVMIQLPWVVPQQPLVTSQIQIDPETKKIPLDIKHSTDTTAIWSFIAAMIASMVIALWYGRRSFKLTEMSFDIVTDQIKSSEKSILNSNSLIHESNKLQIKKQIVVEIVEKLSNLNMQIRTYCYDIDVFSVVVSEKNNDTEFIDFILGNEFYKTKYHDVLNQIKSIEQVSKEIDILISVYFPISQLHEEKPLFMLNIRLVLTKLEKYESTREITNLINEQVERYTEQIQDKVKLEF